MSNARIMRSDGILERRNSEVKDSHSCRSMLGSAAYSDRLCFLDSYLQIAEHVLKKVRRPLAPKAILDLAYLMEIVPPHLHGKTQHKTLQARLSEDIVRNRNRSAFFRTEPGVFFLSEFLTDESLPESFRTPITARRRIRELRGDLVLCISSEELDEEKVSNRTIDSKYVLSKLEAKDCLYKNPKTPSDSDVFIWSTAVVRRERQLLSYRVGRYRDQRDSFLLKRSVGFSAMVEPKDVSLFSEDPFGITESGTNAARIDLEIDAAERQETSSRERSQLRYFVAGFTDNKLTELVGVVYYDCPSWFEPTRKRLAMHDVQWLDLTQPINDLSDFDPWSQIILKYEFEFTPLGST